MFQELSTFAKDMQTLNKVLRLPYINTLCSMEGFSAVVKKKILSVTWLPAKS